MTADMQSWLFLSDSQEDKVCWGDDFVVVACHVPPWKKAMSTLLQFDLQSLVVAQHKQVGKQ